MNAATPGWKGRLRIRTREALRTLYVWSRLPAAALNRCALPAFAVIGAQKAGTTSLFRYLAHHQDVTAPRLKEIHFFDLHYAKGMRWYAAHFPVRRGAFTGEASPYYLFHPRVPERMARHLPDIKLIALLRNPVDRAWSHYNYEVQYGTERLGFREALERERRVIEQETARLLRNDRYVSHVHQHASYLSRGLYAEQLRRWLERFPRDQILVLKAEEFFDDTRSQFGRVLEFLDLPAVPGGGFSAHNPGRYPGGGDLNREELREFFRPHNAILSELLRADFTDWD